MTLLGSGSRIAQVETFRVDYPIVGKFRFFRENDGRPPQRETIVVKITDDAGRTGWGQSVPSPTWSYETTDTVRTTIDRHLGPVLIGLDPFDDDAVQRVLRRTIAPSFSTGQPICKAGIDLALFDLTGRALRQTAAQRWGRAGQQTVTLSWTVDVAGPAAVAESLAEATARGFHHFNIKVGGEAAVDVAVCRELRRQAPNAFMWADANGGYDVETALTVAPQLADVGIAALEQPLPANRLCGYQRLRRQRALPILMDEGIVSRVDLEEFHRLDLLDGVAMKVSRCGGLTEARRIVEYLEQHGLLFFASGLTDPDLSLAASLLLYGALGLERPAALNGPQFLSGSILQSPLIVVDEQASVPADFGLGVTVDEQAVRTADAAH